MVADETESVMTLFCKPFLKDPLRIMAILVAIVVCMGVGMCVRENGYYRLVLACQQNQKQERLIWADKSTKLQITAGYETAQIYCTGKL